MDNTNCSLHVQCIMRCKSHANQFATLIMSVVAPGYCMMSATFRVPVPALSKASL